MYIALFFARSDLCHANCAQMTQRARKGRMRRTILNCLKFLFFFQVSWIRERDTTLLSVGRYTYTTDQGEGQSRKIGYKILKCLRIKYYP
jgi:hypothetical protein